ncbi:MAG: hypothetical protein JNK82_02015 [Myxococcaceae bacterium]|nr:hypothetical protein [Myxococcaceae bacterium]
MPRRLSLETPALRDPTAAPGARRTRDTTVPLEASTPTRGRYGVHLRDGYDPPRSHRGPHLELRPRPVDEGETTREPRAARRDEGGLRVPDIDLHTDDWTVGVRPAMSTDPRYDGDIDGNQARDRADAALVERMAHHGTRPSAPPAEDPRAREEALRAVDDAIRRGVTEAERRDD